MHEAGGSERIGYARTNAAMPEFQAALAGLKEKAELALRVEYECSRDERGEWSHYYYCKDDASRLAFDWNEPHRHVCPACAAVYTGDPYDSAWVTIAHDQIGQGMKAMALLGAIGLREDCISRVRSRLLAYAKHYEYWSVHGGIPYNGPGRLFAQTLDESHWILNLGLAYFFIREHVPEEEQAVIREGLLRPCARFLIEYKEKQLHNHAVLITSAISMIGYLLKDRDIQLEGLEGDYGLLDQLDRGVLEDGFWYEGIFHYHYYAFNPILEYALVVEGTEWDIRSHPALRKMFDHPMNFILPDGSFTKRNDATTNATIGSYAPYYEIALGWYQDDRYKSYLRTAYGIGQLQEPLSLYGYRPVRRDSLYALLFGQDIMDCDAKAMEAFYAGLYSSYSSEPSGVTKLVNREGLHLMVKHGPFGGEHDHMDQLGISLSRGNVPLLADPGTVSYAMPLHYGWYKHTYSHNTIGLNGSDQPPADGRRLGFGEEQWGAWVASATDWNDGSFRFKDNIILPEELSPWHWPSYRKAEIVRVNLLLSDRMVDAVKVTVPEYRQIDLLHHINGVLLEDSASRWTPRDIRFCELKQALFQQKRVLSSKEQQLVWETSEGWLLQNSWCSRQAELLTAVTPGHPPGSWRQTLIQRVNGSETVLFVNIYRICAVREAADRPSPTVKVLSDGALTITDNTGETISIYWSGDAPTFRSYS
jgi:hypothetical protein